MLFIGIAGAQIDRSKQPTPGPAPTIEITQPQTFKLKNGLKVMVVENHKLPRVSVQLLIDNPMHGEANVVGVSTILSGMMGNGTANIDKDTYNEEIDYLGANINFGNEFAAASSLSKYFPRILSLLADGIKNPLFSEEEFNAQKSRYIESLKTSEKSVSEVGRRVNTALTYGKKHPKGEFTTEEVLEGIQLASVKNYYDTFFSPSNAYLVVVGDVTFKDVEKLVKKELSDWRRRDVPKVTFNTPRDVQYSQINFVDMPNAVQSEIAVINLVELKMSDKDYFPAILANHILGGGFSGMINLNLREDKGWTYGAYSGIGAGKEIQRFAATTSVRNQVTDSAVVEIMKEIRNIRTTPVTEERLATAKASYTGDFVRALERPSTIANYALRVETQDLDPDFYVNYLKKLNEVTVADIQRVANKYFKEGNLRIVVTGKGSEVLEGLKNLQNLEGKPLPVTYYDRYANEVEEPTYDIEIDESVTVESILNNYIEAIGGKDKLQKIKNISSESSMNMQGMPLQMKTTVTTNHELFSEMSMNGMVLQKRVFDGENGYESGQGQRVDYDEEQAEAMKLAALPFPELHAKEATLAGAEYVDGKPAYVIQNGKSTKWFYDQKTGLKVLERQTQEVEGQEMSSNTYFSDYKEFEGIMLPTKSTVELAPGVELEINTEKYSMNDTLEEGLFK